MSPAAAKDRLREVLGDQWTRLNSLYRIKTYKGEMTLKCNPEQEAFYWSQHTRNLILKARQFGYTTLGVLLGLDECLFNSAQSVGVIAHTKADAAAIFEDKVRYAYNRLPAEIRKAVKGKTDRAGELRLANGSVIRVSTTFRGGTLTRLHWSEAGNQSVLFPKRAKEVRTGAFPATEKGIITVESTAEGTAGEFYDLCDEARKVAASKAMLHRLAWKFWFTPWWLEPTYRLNPQATVIPQRLRDYFKKLARKHGIELDPWQMSWYAAMERTLGSDMLKEYPSFPDEAFAQAIKGAYFKKQLYRAYQEGRVGKVPPLEGVPVETWWDIGIDDSTTIWGTQTMGRDVRHVFYLEDHDYGLNWYADTLRRLAEEMKITLGKFHFPHDMAVREWGNEGKTRIEVAGELGLKPNEVMEQHNVRDGIDAARRHLAYCWFDEERCERGLKALGNYQKKWDSEMGRYRDKPLKNWAIHGADAFRLEAMGHRFTPMGGRQGFSSGLPREAVR